VSDNGVAAESPARERDRAVPPLWWDRRFYQRYEIVKNLSGPKRRYKCIYYPKCKASIYYKLDGTSGCCTRSLFILFLKAGNREYGEPTLGKYEHNHELIPVVKRATRPLSQNVINAVK
jgi:hypothetical protein